MDKLGETHILIDNSQTKRQRDKKKFRLVIVLKVEKTNSFFN